MEDKQDLSNLTPKEIKLKLERILMEKQLYDILSFARTSENVSLIFVGLNADIITLIR